MLLLSIITAWNSVTEYFHSGSSPLLLCTVILQWLHYASPVTTRVAAVVPPKSHDLIHHRRRRKPTTRYIISSILGQLVSWGELLWFKIRQDVNAFVVTVRRNCHKITVQVVHSERIISQYKHVMWTRKKETNKQTITFNYNATIIIIICRLQVLLHQIKIIRCRSWHPSKHIIFSVTLTDLEGRLLVTAAWTSRVRKCSTQ